MRESDKEVKNLKQRLKKSKFKPIESPLKKLLKSIKQKINGI